MLTLAEIREADAKAGRCFFSRETMRFFGTRKVHGPYRHGARQYIVTLDTNAPSAKYALWRIVEAPWDIRHIGRRNSVKACRALAAEIESAEQCLTA